MHCDIDSISYEPGTIIESSVIDNQSILPNYSEGSECKLYLQSLYCRVLIDPKSF